MPAQRLFQTTADQISLLIEQGLFPPRSRLPTERALASRFDVSRTTIREAVIALQATGQIEVRKGSGAFVLEKRQTQFGSVSNISAFEVTEARSFVEGEAAALAAKFISDEDLSRLSALLVAMRSNDPDVANKADCEFHTTIARASGNRVLLHTTETYWRMRTELLHVKVIYDAVCDHDPHVRAEEHRAVLEALHKRDPVRARDAMQRHFRRLIASMLEVSEREALRGAEQRISRLRERFVRAQ